MQANCIKILARTLLLKKYVYRNIFAVKARKNPIMEEVSVVGKKVFVIFSMLLGLVLFSVSVQAAGLPVVNWSPNVFSIDGEVSGEHLLDDAARQEIVQAISMKLQKLQQEGRLPFQLKEVSTEINASFNEDSPIGLIPIVVADMSFDSAYRIGEQSYYKSMIISGLDLAFCAGDEESHSWRILGMIPLRYYDTAGSDPRHLLTGELTPEQKSQLYARITRAGIEKGLDFRKAKSLLRNLETRSVSPDTYQVTEVEITSRKASELYGDRIPQIKNLLGGFFTSSYEEKTQHVVYPARTGDAWKNDVSQNLFSMQLNSPAGSLEVSMEAPKHSIQLELTGIAQGDVQMKQVSDVQKNVAYKVWLKKTPVEGSEQAVVTPGTVRQYSKLDETAIQIDPTDVFTELLIEAAKDLGNQKI